MGDTGASKILEEMHEELFDETFLDKLDPEEWDIEAVRVHNRSYAEAMVNGDHDIIECLVQNQSYLRRKPKDGAESTLSGPSTVS